MTPVRRLLSKCKDLFRSRQMEQDLEREIGSHLGLMEEEFLRRGMTAEEARLAARRAYGGVEQAKQLHRERSIVWLVGAGFLTRSLRNLEHQDFGFQTANRYVLHLDPLAAGYQPEKLDTLNEMLEQQLAAIPGIETVGLAIYSPLDGNGLGRGCSHRAAGRALEQESALRGQAI